jgi:serine/threonine-protein kinase
VLGLIGKTVSHYTILEQIGQGGMSSVFSAVDLRDQRAVAIKVLSPYIAHETRFKARFEREIKLLGRLQHPNIMPILDFGETEGLAYIVMPYIGTGTLADRLQKGPLQPKDGARVVEQLSSALATAHAAGVVHRDVKPSNVLLDPLGNVLLSDFSFAHQEDASQNLTGSALIGTPAYMSPEQCRGEKIDARSDQYALAVVLYQMTTGQLPFEGDTPMATALKHVNEPLPRPRLINPKIPEEIELVLVKALAKDPALRFDSVLALNAAFQEALRLALDPGRRTPTRDAARTTAIYNKYQNVQPRARRRWYRSTAVAAALLLLLGCPASAAALGVFYPGLLSGGTGAAAFDVQGTVDVLLTLNAPGPGTAIAPSDLQTAVYVAVIQTLTANGTPMAEFGVEPIAFELGGGGSATPLPVTLFFPTPVPTAVRTSGPGSSGGVTPSPTRTPTPDGAATGVASATPGATATDGGGPDPILLTDVPGATATSGASATSAPATATSAPAATSTSPAPTATSAPTAAPTAAPTDPPPPTNPPPTSQPTNIPPGQCGKKGNVCTPEP